MKRKKTICTDLNLLNRVVGLCLVVTGISIARLLATASSAAWGENFEPLLCSFIALYISELHTKYLFDVLAIHKRLPYVTISAGTDCIDYLQMSYLHKILQLTPRAVFGTL